ncbi:alanine dehydrogenase [Vibrio variabilis]|uniref:Alanine dehydrogenase n=1 Tax=Vibrio variabilis TaxID=990271 RepID=A0ABQ0JKC9_9VIBR|nr:alanine dehydrogenase [Vibrio variabilis]
MDGLNVIHGKVTCKEVAESFDLEYVEPATLSLCLTSSIEHSY